jgi:hypothetical protein
VQAKSYLAQPMTGGGATFTFHRLRGDLHGDMDVDAVDFARHRQWVARPPSAGFDLDPLDLSGDGRLNVLDLAALRRRMGRRLP